MQISEISFADKIAYNIKSDDTKKYILDSLDRRYNLKIITKHHERFAPNLIQNINNNPHMMCLRSNGNPYFLHMFRYNFTNYCVFIDKKIQQGYYYPRMIICNFHFDDSLFEDTVVEGEMVKTNSGRWAFIINDLLVLKGEYLKDCNLVRRLNLLYETLEKDFVEDSFDICRFSVKRYFKYDQLRYMLQEHMPRLPYTCRGIYFKPLFLRFKDVLVNFDDSVVKKVERKRYKNVSNFLLKEDSPVIEEKKEEQTKNSKHGMFTARKTSNPDIYDLFDSQGTPCGTACIPSMKISKAMRVLFENKNLVDKVSIRCEYSEKFAKYVPVIG